MALLEIEVLKLVESLEREGAVHDAAEPERRRKRLNLERPAAELLHRITDGTLVTIDREPSKLEEACKNLSAAGLPVGATLFGGRLPTWCVASSGPSMRSSSTPIV